METSFIVDSNVGKLARWLRMMGYDTLFFKDIEDGHLVDIAVREGRVVVTRDTQIAKRRAAVNGSLRVILSRDDDPKEQLRQVLRELDINCEMRQFTRCLECNQRLVPRMREELVEFRRLKGYVPRTVLIHLDPQHEAQLGQEVAEVARELGASITLGWEGMKVSV